MTRNVEIQIIPRDGGEWSPRFSLAAPVLEGNGLIPVRECLRGEVPEAALAWLNGAGETVRLYVPRGESEDLTGHYQVQEVAETRLTAFSLDRVIADAPARTGSTPRRGVSCAGEATRLAYPVRVTWPAGEHAEAPRRVWDTDRLAALDALAGMLGHYRRPDAAGGLYIGPPDYAQTLHVPAQDVLSLPRVSRAHTAPNTVTVVWETSEGKGSETVRRTHTVEVWSTEPRFQPGAYGVIRHHFHPQGVENATVARQVGHKYLLDAAQERAADRIELTPRAVHLWQPVVVTLPDEAPPLAGLIVGFSWPLDGAGPLTLDIH